MLELEAEKLGRGPGTGPTTRLTRLSDRRGETWKRAGVGWGWLDCVAGGMSEAAAAAQVDAMLAMGATVRVRPAGVANGSPAASEGTVFAADRATGTLVLYDPRGLGYRLVPLGALAPRDVTVLAPATDASKAALENLPPVDEGRVDKRERKAIADAEADARRINSGVGEEAQLVMDALGKTLPCEWDGDVISIFQGEVLVSPPYVTPESVRAPKGEDRVSDRVRMIVATEVQRQHALVR